LSSKYVVVVRQRETKRDDKSVGCKEKGEIKSDEDRVILRDEKNFESRGQNRREKQRERRKAKEREAGTRNKTTFLIVQIFFERLFPFFLPPFECVREE